MDTHDVSSVPDYMHVLRNHKRTLQNAQSQKGRRPKRTKSRDEIIMQFEFRSMMGRNAPLRDNTIRSSFISPAYTPSVAALSSLKQVVIKDLVLETHHRGSYILLRAVTPTDVMTAVMVIVEDEEGDVLMLQLYNQGEGLAVDGRLVKGTVMIVKEPYLKVMSDGDYGIRVDHLSDISFLPEHDPQVPLSWRRQLMETDISANDWRLEGNDHFHEGRYHLAIECYTQALESSPTVKEALTIKLNCALSHLKIHHFEATLHDLKTTSPDSESLEKTLFRKAQALYYLQRFQESCETHRLLAKKYPENTAAKTEFNRAKACLAEQQSGEYKFKRMQLEATKRRPPLLDHATYIGPVDVRPTESCGRGLFTTAFVKAGDLLFCEKAFVHAFHDDSTSSKAVALLINPQTDAITMGTQADLIALIAQKLYKTPSFIPTFTDLHHGSYKPVDIWEIDNRPVVDTFLIERILSLNCFGCPLSSRKSIIQAKQKSEKTDKQFHSCGVWPLASYINHSCYSNARRSFIGDMMIVRATQDLAPNTEINFWYKSPWDNDSKGREVDLRHWGFKCSCIICHELRKPGSGDLAKRNRFEVNIKKALARQNPDLSKIESMILLHEETYRRPAIEFPRLGIWDLYFRLSSLYASRRQFEKAIEFALKTLESLGYVVEGGRPPYNTSTRLLVKKWGLLADGLIECWMVLSRAYREIAPNISTKAEEYARLTYRICAGEDETFDDTYSLSSERVGGLLPWAK